MTHSWLLLEFPHASPVVNVEAVNGNVYLHDDVAESYRTLRDKLGEVALSAPASAAVLRKLLEEM